MYKGKFEQVDLKHFETHHRILCRCEHSFYASVGGGFEAPFPEKFQFLNFKQ